MGIGCLSWDAWVLNANLSQGVISIRKAGIWDDFSQHTLQRRLVNFLLLALVIVVIITIFVLASLLLAATLVFGSLVRFLSRLVSFFTFFSSNHRLDKLLDLLTICRD